MTTETAQQDPLSALIAAVKTFFPDLNFAAPGGILQVRESLASVDRLRIELPGRFLKLQSIGVTADGVDDVAALATVRVSSWFGDFGERFDKARLFDFDSPTGTVVHTMDDELAWIEVWFAQPIDISAIRLRNIAEADAALERGIKVFAGAPGQDLSIVYNGADRAGKLMRLLDAWVSHGEYDADPQIRSMVPVIGRTVIGNYPQARKLEKAAPLSEGTARHYRSVISAMVLNSRNLELTPHGLKRTFRFWSMEEKQAYIRLALKVVNDLKGLTPQACFGFGAALAVIRDGDLIPHDDDLDLIVGFEPHEATTLLEALDRVAEFLRPLGYTVWGTFTGHWHVAEPGSKYLLDVFVGLFEGDTIAWYPGARGSLTREIMFPTTERPLLDIACPVPHDPELYLERVYGAGWRQPDPGFTHAWDPAEYQDLRGSSA
jgi:hypothetical protein